MIGFNPKNGIGGWLGNVWELNRKRRIQEGLLCQSVEQVVDIADPLIRQVRRYRKILQPSVEGAMKYCSGIIDAIPGPVELSRKNYFADPLVKALFATPEQSLGYLENVMNQPGDWLVLQKQSFRLNWMGLRVDEKPEAEGNDITLAEFSVKEELRRSAVLVTFSLLQESLP